MISSHYLDLLHRVVAFLPWLGLIAALVLIFLIFTIVIARALSLRHLVKQKAVHLELTPPAFTDRTVAATEQLFTALHGLGMTRSWRDRLLGLSSVYSLEIVSTRKDGIRYLIRAAEDKAEALEQIISAYLTDVKTRRLDDYIDSIKDATVIAGAGFRQKQHFAYPLQGFSELESHDPISYLTSAMTKLSADERVFFQLVVSPLRLKSVEHLRAQILSNEDVLPKLGRSSGTYIRILTGVVNSVLFSLLGIISGASHGISRSDYQSSVRELEYKKQIARHIKPVRTLSYFEHELIESIHQKLAQPLFRADLRVLISAKNKRELVKRRKAIESALSLYNVPKYQRLQLKRAGPYWIGSYCNYAFIKRLPSVFRKPNILSSSELAGLYHFPNSLVARTENIIKSLSKTLPAPVSLKNGTKLDILLGENTHQGTTTPIGLTTAERERHVYIIGGTGNGKTTMLQYGIIQDIKAGKGLAVLDPHGDLAESILHHIPKERIRDVIYFNPDDIRYPIGTNLLELPDNLNGDDLLREKDLVTESTISVMRKIFSDDDSGGHRIEYILRNAIQTALTLGNPTLFTIYDLLNDTKYRRQVVRNLEDKDLRNFWKNELGKAGEFQKVKMSAGITAKIGRFLFSASAKRVLEQEKSTIDFDDILNSGKILICNFSKGLLGEDTSTLFGTTVLAKLQMASLRRARLNQSARRPFYLYVDEFQNFATMSFVQMLSEARKYRLFLTMAEQSTSQQDQQRLVDIILSNVGTVICFRSGSPADERYVLPLFYPYIEQGEIANLPSFNFYMRIAAVDAQEPLSGRTVLLGEPSIQAVSKLVKRFSRSNYALEYKNEQKPRAEPKTSHSGDKRPTTNALKPAIKSAAKA